MHSTIKNAFIIHQDAFDAADRGQIYNVTHSIPKPSSCWYRVAGLGPGSAKGEKRHNSVLYIPDL